MPGFKNWVAGEILSAADLMRLPQHDLVIKAADQSIASSVTPTDDTHLFLNVAANTNYWIEGYIMYSAHASFDMQATWSFPAGTTFRWCIDALWEPLSVSGEVDRRSQIDTALVAFGGLTGFDLVAMPKGLLRVGGTAGVLRFRWCQWSSGATATIVRSGSMLRATRLS